MKEWDADNWRQVMNGERMATWGDFVGSMQGATYLSNIGRDFLPAMVEGFEYWLGDRWLSRALDPDNPSRINSLARFSPTMTLLRADHGRAGAFIELLRWWASIQTQKDQAGAEQVRHEQRQDVTLPRLLHALTQLRLGAIATEAGLGVVYEPTPGDLLITDGVDLGNAVTVEVFAMTTPHDLDVQTRASDAMFELLRELTREHRVHFHGTLPALGGDSADWERRVRETAAEARRLNVSLCIHWSDQELFVEPGDATEAANLTGPLIETDVGSRLRRKVSLKARQISAAPRGWLWLENHGAVDLMTPIQQMPLGQQLSAYRDLLDGALDGAPSVKGVTVSDSTRRQWPQRPPLRAVDGQCEALRHPLVLDRVRETFHLTNSHGPESHLIRRVIEHEPYWLDSALSRLGVASNALELIRRDLRSA